MKSVLKTVLKPPTTILLMLLLYFLLLLISLLFSLLKSKQTAVRGSAGGGRLLVTGFYWNPCCILTSVIQPKVHSRQPVFSKFSIMKIKTLYPKLGPIISLSVILISNDIIKCWATIALAVRHIISSITIQL